MTSIEPAIAIFHGSAGNRLIADVYGEEGPVVLLLHGGGQTRHAWRETAERLAREGFVAYALDQRGHGDSDWSAEGDYSLTAFSADAAAVAEVLTTRAGTPPTVIGASMGGISALLAEGKAEREGRPNMFAALILVDIAPRIDMGGVAKILGFMGAHSGEGFRSISEAAEAVAAYLPHRGRPRTHDGLKANLRLHPDGRWRWHWDPRFLEGPRPITTGRTQIETDLIDAARRIAIPALLVRGASSELVRETHVQQFLELVPHAEYVDVAGARHMVAGDSNDAFSHAILTFLARCAEPKASLNQSLTSRI